MSSPTDPQPVYTAPSETAAAERFAEFANAWGQQYPAIVRLWEPEMADRDIHPTLPRRAGEGRLAHREGGVVVSGLGPDAAGSGTAARKHPGSSFFRKGTEMAQWTTEDLAAVASSTHPDIWQQLGVSDITG